MANICGIELRAYRTEKNTDGSETRIGSFYLQGKKIATVVMESGVADCEPAVQVFMMKGYSEAALSAVLDAAGFTPESAYHRLIWLVGLEKEFMHHLGIRNGGMIALDFEGAQITMGIPLRLGQSSEEEILESLERILEEKSRSYGQLRGYLIFRSPEEFSLGTPVYLEALRE